MTTALYVPFSVAQARAERDHVRVDATLADDEPFGEWVKARRQSLGLSLRQLAEKTLVSNPYLSQVERGWRSPDDAVRARLIAALSDPEEGP